MKAFITLVLGILLFSSCKKDEEELLTLTINGDHLDVVVQGHIQYTGEVFTRWQREAMVSGGEVIDVQVERIARDSTLVNGVWIPEYDLDIPIVVEASITNYGGGPFRSVGSQVHPTGVVFYLQVPEL